MAFSCFLALLYHKNRNAKKFTGNLSKKTGNFLASIDLKETNKRSSP